MDLFALEAANAMVGNPVDAAAFEWALGGGTVRFERDCVFAIGGATLIAPSGTDPANRPSDIAVAGGIVGDAAAVE